MDNKTEKNVLIQITEMAVNRCICVCVSGGSEIIELIVVHFKECTCPNFIYLQIAF